MNFKRKISNRYVYINRCVLKRLQHKSSLSGDCVKMSLQKLKNIDIKSKYLINGYIRNVQQNLLPHDIPFFIIPPSIVDICLLFFYIFNEWDVDSKPMKIKVEGDTITSLADGSWNTILMKNVISNGKWVWKFKILNREYSCILIGILRNDKKSDYGEYIGDLEYCSYAFDGSWASISTYDKLNNWDGHYGIKLKTNDIVEMHIDLDELSLSFVINDKSYGKSHDIVKGEYVAAISFCQAKDSIQILH